MEATTRGIVPLVHVTAERSPVMRRKEIVRGPGPTPRNPAARALAEPRFRKQVVAAKRRPPRHPKHKGAAHADH